MGAITVSSETNESRAKFFNAIWVDQQGWVFLAEKTAAGAFSEYPFRWPDQRNDILERVNTRYVEGNIYFCPQVFAEAKRRKHLAVSSAVAWADMDDADPRAVEPKPSIVVESSPRRWQAYWKLDEPVAADTAEDYSHRLAWAFRAAGADLSGWDLTQLLRVPLTYNFKYPTTPPIPDPVYLRGTVPETELSGLPEPPGRPSIDLKATPLPTSFPAAADVLARYNGQIPPHTKDALTAQPAEDWSSSLWAIETALFESGMAPDEVFAVVQGCASDKYTRDGRPSTDLWRDVLKAQDYVATKQAAPPVAWVQKDTLTEDERREVDGTAEDFIDRYRDWAVERTDASEEYHLASALMCLSGVIAASVRLPTSADDFKLNLWTMVLADTTLSRKSTALKYGLGILRAVDPDAVAATEASIEGLLDELAKRPGRPALFYRDELSGLFAQFQGRDYLSGMPQTLAHLYDGTDQKRVLRTKTVDVRDPIFSFYGGGVMARIFSICDESFIIDGFFPRFLFFIGEADASKSKPLGPPTKEQDSRRYELIEELRKIKDRYDLTMSLRLRTGETVGAREPWSAFLTDESWERYNAFERQLQLEGNESDAPFLYVPMFARLSVSTLKVAAIVAAARQDPQDHEGVVIERIDILKAIGLAARWRDNAIKVVKNVGKSGTEKLLDAIVDYIMDHPGGVARGELMRRFRLTSRDAVQVFETLEQRGMLSRSKTATSEIMYMTREAQNV